MSCKIKCLYYSEECEHYCKYALMVSSEYEYARIVKENLEAYGDEYQQYKN